MVRKRTICTCTYNFEKYFLLNRYFTKYLTPKTLGRVQREVVKSNLQIIVGWVTNTNIGIDIVSINIEKRFRFSFCFTLCSTARVILRQVVYGWRNQCILVGQDSAL